MSKRILWGVVFSLVVGFTGSAHASNFGDTYGFGATGIAMGNAMTAVVSDWSSVYYNMGGLGKTVHLKGAAVKDEGDSALSLKKKEEGAKEESAAPRKAYLNQLAVSYMYNMPGTSIDYKGTNTLEETDVPASSHIILGVVIDLNLIYEMPKFISSARLGLGLGANGDGTIVKLNDIDPRTHDYLRLGREEQKSMILVGAGFGFLNDAFGFGVGANVGFKGQGSVIMDNVDIDGDPQTPDSQAKMDLSAMPTLLAGIYFSPGQIWSAVKGLELGISYRQEHYMVIDPFNAAAVTTAVTMQLVMAIYDYYSPDIYTFGAAYSRWKTTFSFDIDYQLWSKNRYSSTLTKNNPDLPKFQDIMCPKLGVKHDALSWLSIMAGYIYQPSFIPDSAVTGAYNFLDNDKHILSLGTKFLVPQLGGFRGPIEITLGYQYQGFVPRTVRKDDPANPDNPSYAYGGSAQSVILEVTMKL